ncbi:MAG: BCD family MFS transporter [Chloroflexaceae bacterium]|jgi:BCD family chlorophyll transporter-like MFS transporter|nr:BCD family MFS transporter [Chloroflexaceae bacterium]
MQFLRLAVKAVRLALIRVGAGWMFALLTFNFNRTAIADLGVIAILVTVLIGLHHFLSPFQVVWGRLADRHPIFGYRRTPYILLSSLVASLVFLTLPTIAANLPSLNEVMTGLDGDSILATLGAFVVVAIFGISMSMNGSASNALIAEVTSEKERGGIIAFVWATIIISGIVSAGVAGSIMPSYDPAKMQQLYNLTPFIALISAFLGVVGMEKRVSRETYQAQIAAEPEGAGPLTTIRVATRLMRTNLQVRLMFVFILLAIMGIFLQDAILEPFGAEVFGMIQKETARFQVVWGTATLLSMFGIGVLSGIFPIAKKTIATIGGLGVAGGLGIFALAAATHQRMLIDPGLILLGTGIGMFNVGALAMMMEMTIEGQAGFYMGMWGMAQGLGNGFANVLSGAFHTLLIDTGWLNPLVSYTLIFAGEAVLMVAAIGVLRSISTQEFKGLSRGDLKQTLALDAAR